MNMHTTDLNNDLNTTLATAASNIDPTTKATYRNRGVLVRVKIGAWGSTVTDEKSSEQVRSDNAVKTKNAARVSKKLLANNKTLKRLSSMRSQARTWVNTNTIAMPYGQQVTPDAFASFDTSIKALKKEYESMADAFKIEYRQEVAADAFTLGTMFDRSQYPSEDEVRAAFYFDIIYTPIPGDAFLDTLEDDIRAELQEQYEQATTTYLHNHTRSLWDRLHKHLKHIGERLTAYDSRDDNDNNDTEDGQDNDTTDTTDKKPKRRKLHASMIDNALETCDVLSRLNITGDPALEQARRDIESLLAGAHIGALRDSEGARVDLRNKVKALTDKFDF